MNIQNVREIQSTGTSHDVIEAIVTYLEERETKAPKVEKPLKKGEK